MKTLHGYVLREHAGPLLFSLAILISILMMNQIVLLFDKIVGKGLDGRVILEVFGLCVPFIFATTLPMAVLVSTLWAFGRLSADNEIVAMKAGGVSLVSVIRPLLLAALLLAVVMAWFNNVVLPKTNYRLRSILVDISYQKPAIEIQEGVLMDDLSGYSLLVGKVDQRNSRLYDVTIYDGSAGGVPRTILAKEGEMAFSEDREHLILTLRDGEIHRVDPENIGNYQKIDFKTQTIIIRDVGNRFRRREHGNYRTDREMSGAMMIEEIAANRDRIEALQTEIRETSTADTLHAIGSGDSSGDRKPASGPPALREADDTGGPLRSVDIQRKEREIAALEKRDNQLRVEVHKKFSIPFASIVFVLLGVPLRLSFRGGGAGTVIVLSLVTFMVYYIFLTGGENLADRGVVDPMLAMWTPNLIFGAAGVILLARSVRETSFPGAGIPGRLRRLLRGREQTVEGH